jgi:hypothetical protein
MKLVKLIMLFVGFGLISAPTQAMDTADVPGNFSEEPVPTQTMTQAAGGATALENAMRADWVNIPKRGKILQYYWQTPECRVTLGDVCVQVIFSESHELLSIKTFVLKHTNDDIYLN